ncbi:type I protein arginine methyltransferase [Trifolium repens]|nr:type I protein arginine methyltransferase [Trifolium repens]
MERQNNQTHNNKRARLAPPTGQHDSCDREYFNSYNNVSLHQNLIKDNVWTKAYKTAIEHHQQQIAGKIVLDVGCGTGLLSILCAQAGASKVYAIDASDIAKQAETVVLANNLSDIITVLHGRVEDLQLSEKVDVIISNWMGYMLLHEGMLASVIFARDRWLKPGGLMLPSHATLYLAPVTTNKHRDCIDSWRNVEGIDMSAIIPMARTHAFQEPIMETLSSENVLAEPCMVKYINTSSVTMHELETIATEFHFIAMKSAPLSGFAIWFDVEFAGNLLSPFPIRCRFPLSSADGVPAFGNQRQRTTNLNEALVMSTGPEDPPTHWKQTLIYCWNPREIENGQVIKVKLSLSKSFWSPRSICINVEYTLDGQDYFVYDTVMK